MRFKQIVETTTAGSVATVAQPMMTQTREDTNVRGLKPVQQVMKGTAKKKGPYANSIVEGKVKELSMDLRELTDQEFQKKYGQPKAEIRASMKKEVNEEEIAEQDLIVIPGQGRLRRTGFVKHDLDQGEHEGHTLKNSLHTIARAASELDKRLSVQSEFPEWVSEKIGAAKGMMVSVMDYLISSQEMQHDSDAMEGSENKYSNLSNRGVNRGINRAADDFNRMMDLDQAESPHYKTQHQQDTKQRLKTKPMAGPKGVLPEQGVAEGDMYGDAEVSWEKGGRRAPTGAFRNPNFGNVLQKSVNKHNKAIVKTRQDIGSRIADIGAGGKEHNEKTDAAWDAAKKKVSEGAKVDRMVKYVKQSEKKLGHSDKEAENIVWATANKRGMLDNKNKKK